MEFDEFLGQAKWQILEIILKRPSSPIEIAGKINTSVAYVSQQLKILEAVNLVSKEKTGEFQKGKPRSLYSISKDAVYITSLLKGSPQKRLLYPSESQKIIVRIWMIENGSYHYPIEKYYWKIEDHLSKIDCIYFMGSKVIVVSTDKNVVSTTKLFSKNKFDNLEFQVVSKFDQKHLHSTHLHSTHLHSIYDPLKHLTQDDRS